jgi:hypothetical protein
VWHYFGENKTPSSLLGSPLDYLPNCAPSALPMPPRHNNQELRHQIRECEQLIKDRSRAVESESPMCGLPEWAKFRRLGSCIFKNTTQAQQKKFFFTLSNNTQT